MTRFAVAKYQAGYRAQAMFHVVRATLEADTDLSEAIGQPIIDHFIAIKRKEWNDYLDHTTDWEMDTYLEFI